MRTLAFFAIVAALFSACSSSNTVDRPDGSQGEPCGAVTCDVDQVCCNASCGICAPPGVSCTTVECEPPDECAPMDASPVELCEVLLGYAYDGEACVSLTGCSCEGSDCDALFDSLEDCQAACAPDDGDGEPISCGGFTGAECPSGYWCDYEDELECQGAGLCKKHDPKSCVGAGKVCGCDYVTYDSICEARAAGVDVLHDGGCK